MSAETAAITGAAGNGRTASLTVGVLLYMLAPLGMSLIPMTVGGAVESLGLDAVQAGLVAAADLSGLALASVVAAILIKSIPWRTAAAAGILLIAAGSLYSLLAGDFLNLCAARFVTEFGSGVVYAVALIVLGGTASPDRYYAMGLAATIGLAVIAFIWLAPLIESRGIAWLFIFHGGIAVVLIPGLVFLRQGSQTEAGQDIDGPKDYRGLYLCFVAIICLYIAEGGLWSYVERIGNRGGLSAEEVGNGLALSQLFSFAAALTASALSNRFGRSLPLLFGSLLFICSLYLIQQAGTLMFFWGVCLSQFAWIFMVPYLLGLAVALDPSGRLYIFAITCQMGGFAAGPALISVLIGHEGFAVISWVGGLMALASLLLVLPLAARLDRTAG